MRVLITGSSGQIGTNLGLTLLANGHSVFGVDRRQNTWTDAFPTVVQDLGMPYRDFAGCRRIPSATPHTARLIQTDTGDTNIPSSSLRPPRCVSTGPEVVRLAGMANERVRERSTVVAAGGL